MVFDAKVHHRRSIRLRGFDYASAGAYFVTICAQGRECLFGEIVDEAMQPNAAGRMVAEVWNDLPQHYPGIDVDAHMVMPNHFHGIAYLTPPSVGAGPRACPDFTGPRACPDFTGPRACPDLNRPGHPQGGAPTLELFDLVHRFKSLTTAHYRHAVVEQNWTPFPGRLWQRNYYERIIRDDEELFALRDYIANNPLQWPHDAEYPT